MRVSIISKTGAQLVDRYMDEDWIARQAEDDPKRIYFLPECWENLIASLRYKPWWFFEYIREPYNGDPENDLEKINIQMRVPDRDNPSTNTYVGAVYHLGRWMGETWGRELIRDFIRQIEMHEIDEQILFDGERVFDPHKTTN